MNRDDLLYLQNILDAIARVEMYVAGFDQENFQNNVLVQDGVIRQITIMGEATKLLSDELRDRYSQVPWRQIARMRDTRIHRYFGVDIEQVWLTVRTDLPTLKAEIARIVDEIRAEHGGDRKET